MEDEITALDENLTQHFHVASLFGDVCRTWLMDLPTSYGRRVLAAFRLYMLTEVAGVSAATSDIKAWQWKLHEMVKHMWVCVGKHVLSKSDPAKVMLDDLVYPPDDLNSARAWYEDEFEKRISLPMQDRMHSYNGVWAGQCKLTN